MGRVDGRANYLALSTDGRKTVVQGGDGPEISKCQNSGKNLCVIVDSEKLESSMFRRWVDSQPSITRRTKCNTCC
jgi:hypothetical protein